MFQLMINCLTFKLEKKNNFARVITRCNARYILFFHVTCSLMKTRNIEIHFMANSKEEKVNSPVSGEIWSLSDNCLKSSPERF